MLFILLASGEALVEGPATWDGHPRCQLAGGEDAAVADNSAERSGNQVSGA